MEILYFACLFLKIILASEGAGTATGEAKIIFGEFDLLYYHSNNLHLANNVSFTYFKGGVRINEDDYYEG